MAHHVHIRRVQTHAALSPNSPLAGAEIARRVGATLKEELDAVFSALSISPDVTVCIRRLALNWNYRPDWAQAELRREWIRELTTTLHRVLAQSDPDVVVFYTARHLLVDMALGIAFLDFRRKWAWFQSPQVRPHVSESTSPEQAWVDTMIAEAAPSGSLGEGGIVAVWVELAKQGALPALWNKLLPNHHQRLLQSVLSTAKPASFAASAHPSAPHTEAMDTLWAQGLDWSRSHIIGALSTSPHPTSGDSHTTLLLFGLLELEPLALHRGPKAIEWALSSAMQFLSPAPLYTTPSDTESAPSDIRRSRSEETPDSITAHRQHDPRLHPSLPDFQTASADESRADATILPFAKPTQRGPNRQSTPGQSPEITRARDSLSDDSIAVDPPAQLATVLQTEFAGLLFLVHGVCSLGLVESLLHNEVFCGRPIRFWLVLLARHWVPLLPLGDAAEFAFAGLAPGGPLPTDHEPSLSNAEQLALDDLAARLVPWLENRLGPLDLDFVIRRHARIVFEPGWIDVILNQQQVSTEIRRAGLDLDPGYLPWIGCVVRFVYE